ncbi:hypothetical protein [Sphingobacterium faecium]|uniref:hypothetical protein n=1 Tax=Sphingobacterium faecium TaxID=34087 RepID=UPI00320B35CE
MKKIIKKISGVIQVILLAPVKLPGKVLDIIKYIGLGLGIIESVIDQDEEKNVMNQNNDQSSENQKDISIKDKKVLNLGIESEKESDPNQGQLQIVKYDLETGEEVIDETK